MKVVHIRLGIGITLSLNKKGLKLHRTLYFLKVVIDYNKLQSTIGVDQGVI